MKKGGGIGPEKPWQPALIHEKVPNPFGMTEKISSHLFTFLPFFLI